MSEHIYEDSDMEHERYHVIPFGSMREEIVRCRDCDYYNHWDAYGPYREKHVCGRWDYLEIEPNGFCAWGERRTDDN